jgi:hypothetical protein
MDAFDAKGTGSAARPMTQSCNLSNGCTRNTTKAIIHRYCYIFLIFAVDGKVPEKEGNGGFFIQAPEENTATVLEI